MSVKVTNNSAAIKTLVAQNMSIALRLIVSAIETESTPHTPKRTGDLRKNILKQVLGLKGKIQWNQRYAVYQEAKQYPNYTTPGTGAHFAENAVKKVVENSDKYFAQVGIK